MTYADKMRELHASYAPVLKLLDGAAVIASDADAQIAALQAECEALRADAERMDWLARKDLQALAMCIVKDGPNDGEYMVYGDGVPGFGKTFRDAIDAAIDNERSKA